MRQIMIIIIMTTMAIFWFWAFPMVIYGSDDVSPDIEKMVVVEVGTDAYDLLNVKGYSIIESNVNFNKIGTYLVKYQNNKGDYFERSVKVIEFNINKNDTLSWVSEKEYKEEESISYYSEAFTMCLLDGNKYAYAYKYKERNDYSPLHHVFVDIIDGISVKNSFLLSYSSDSIVSKMIYDEGKIVGTGYDKDLNGNYLLWLFIIDLNTNKITRKYYGSSGDTYSQDLVSYASSYYVVGSTNSKTYPFDQERMGSDGFVISIDKDSLQIKMTKTFPLSGNDSINSVLIHNHLLYLTQVSGPSNNKTKILLVDIYGNLLKSFDFDYPYANQVIKMDLNSEETQKIYVLMSLFNYQKQMNVERLYELTEDLKLILLEENDNPNWQIIDISIKNYLTYLMKPRNNYNGFKMLSKSLSGEVIFEHQNNNTNIIPISFVNGSKRIVMGKDFYTLQTMSVLVDSIVINNQGSGIVEEEDNHYYNVQINHENVQHDKDKSIYEIDLNLFGKYRAVYVFDTPELILSYSAELEVKPDFSVSHKQEYDVGIKLEFNGMGTLNGEKIYPGKTLNEVGDYLLTVRGYNDQDIMIEFNVSKLSFTKDETKPNGQPKITFDSSDEKIINAVEFDFVSRDIDNEISSKVNQDYWFLIIPLTTLLFASFVFVKMRG